ncbi:SAC3/GANP/Nin1/mts3/eIF-3 p25 family-domain-containing protein [Xylariaceae sp. FL0594]|nr:SAC3/GANP/Nin1/mts3/eIF-3 p25 family-domain-containing protein [Xylariaceae sp. FL0594]
MVQALGSLARSATNDRIQNPPKPSRPTAKPQLGCPFVSLSACCCCCLPWFARPQITISTNSPESLPPFQTNQPQQDTPAEPKAKPFAKIEVASGRVQTADFPVLGVITSSALPSPPTLSSQPTPTSIPASAPQSLLYRTTPALDISSQTATMAERNLQQILSQLKSHPNAPYAEASKLLSKAKIALLQLKAVTPSPSTAASHLALAREVYEAGALFSIRAKNAEVFTRYVSQLQPFYELADETEAATGGGENRNKVTGLYLLLLLTQGRYAEFHSELEALSTRARGSEEIEHDRYLGYPIKLERWLMEGSYDRVWKAMKSREVPSEEYGVFSEILTIQIRSEIASSSERAYPSLPLSSTKSLLFLDSEGAVVEFARQRGWAIRDGHIYFPTAEGADDTGDAKDISQMVIENALGYARELETIV